MYLHKIKKFILDVLFPVSCIGCGKKDEVLCDCCFSNIPSAERETERDIIALFDYRNKIIRNIIWELKYHHKKYLGERLGEILYDSLIEEIENIRLFSLGEPIIVIPVPISKNRSKTRGYNQSYFIAKGLCSKNKNIFTLEKDIIFRKNNNNNPQARISNRKERLRNVLNAFYIKNEDKIKNRVVIIIDDVTTTGGTINEIIKVLKSNKVKKVIGMTIAH